MILASIVAVSCALPGVFLVLRRMSLMSDAISHAILLGIVLVFFLTKSLHSPWLILGAAVMGLLTVTLTEVVVRTRKLKEDAAIGLVFPLLFSIGVILINKFLSDIHIDADCVLFGEIAFTPFNRLIIGGMDLGPQAIWTMTGILILNVLFISFFYKELKVGTFDPGLAAALGLMPAVLHYALMTIVSITCVGAFESVGSILVVALMITPPATAYLLTDRLSRMLILSAVIGVVSAVSGYWLAYILDANIAGSMATMAGVIFGFVFIFAPDRGVMARMHFKRMTKWDFGVQMLMVHLLQSEATSADLTERVVSHMRDHMLWEDVYTSEVIAQGIQDGFVRKEGDMLKLTPFGREKAKTVLARG